MTLWLIQACLGRNYHARWCRWVKPIEQMHAWCRIQCAANHFSFKNRGSLETNRQQRAAFCRVLEIQRTIQRKILTWVLFVCMWHNDINNVMTLCIRKEIIAPVNWINSNVCATFGSRVEAQKCYTGRSWILWMYFQVKMCFPIYSLL